MKDAARTGSEPSSPFAVEVEPNSQIRRTVVVLAGVGLGAAFWSAPETMQAQLQALREMLGA